MKPSSFNTWLGSKPPWYANFEINHNFEVVKYQEYLYELKMILIRTSTITGRVKPLSNTLIQNLAKYIRGLNFHWGHYKYSLRVD